MLRDIGMRGFDTVYLLAGLSEEIVRALLTTAPAVARRERLAGARADGGAVDRLVDDVPDVVLIEAARVTGRPLGTVVSGDRAAILLPHELADGVEGTRLIGVLLQAAVDGRIARRVPSVRLALVRALVAGGRPAVRAYIAGREERRSMPDPGESVPVGPGRFARLTVDASPGSALRRMRSTGGRATPMTRVGSVALAALGAISAAERDIRVVLPADLRHLVRGPRVAGNLVSAEAYGTLRGTDWSPASIGRMVAARRVNGAVPLAASVARTVLSRSGGGDPRPPTVGVSLLGVVPLPVVQEGAPPTLSATTMGPSAGTFVFAAQVGPAITVSLWDDSGAFDVAEFPAEFLAEMERRAP